MKGLIYLIVPILFAASCAQEAGKNQTASRAGEQVSPPQLSKMLEATKGNPTVVNVYNFNGDVYGGGRLPMANPPLPTDVNLLNAATQPAQMA